MKLSWLDEEESIWVGCCGADNNQTDHKSICWVLATGLRTEDLKKTETYNSSSSVGYHLQLEH